MRIVSIKIGKSRSKCIRRETKKRWGKTGSSSNHANKVTKHCVSTHIYPYRVWIPEEEKETEGIWWFTLDARYVPYWYWLSYNNFFSSLLHKCVMYRLNTCHRVDLHFLFHSIFIAIGYECSSSIQLVYGLILFGYLDWMLCWFYCFCCNRNTDNNKYSFKLQFWTTDTVFHGVRVRCIILVPNKRIDLLVCTMPAW